MTQNYTSKTLYHFVGARHPKIVEANYETLSKILESGSVLSSGRQGVSFTIDWSKNIYEGELLNPTVACYADIPLDCLSIHASKYGEFGVGFDRGELAIRGARPVTYMPYHPADHPQLSIHGRVLIDRIVNAARDFDENVIRLQPEKGKTGVLRSKPAIEEVSTILMRDLLAYIKPFKITDGDDDPSNVYMEREWRMYGNFNFAPEWVHEVIVSPEFVERASERFPAYADRVRACPR